MKFLDKEIKEMFQIILEKLDGMDRRQDGMDQKLTSIEKRQDSMDQKLVSIEKRQDGMDKRLISIEKRQDEIFVIQRALEENIMVTRAEQDKMMHMVADIQGKATRLTSEVEEHDEVIKQIKAIK